MTERIPAECFTHTIYVWREKKTIIKVIKKKCSKFLPRQRKKRAALNDQGRNTHLISVSPASETTGPAFTAAVASL